MTKRQAKIHRQIGPAKETAVRILKLPGGLWAAGPMDGKPADFVIGRSELDASMKYLEKLTGKKAIVAPELLMRFDNKGTFKDKPEEPVN